MDAVAWALLILVLGMWVYVTSDMQLRRRVERDQPPIDIRLVAVATVASVVLAVIVAT
jgi:uncharacterized membrane protein YidH (DUF202 family)